MTKRRIEIELDEQQLARLDRLCQELGTTRDDLLAEGVQWVFQHKDRTWDIDDPFERDAALRLSLESLLRYEAEGD